MIRHFKKEMAYRIQQGLKTKTTRYKAWKEQEISTVVYGSRYKPIKFGSIKVNSVIPTTWRDAIRSSWREEGFASPEAMEQYITKEKIVRKDLSDDVWTMEFEYQPNLKTEAEVIEYDH